MKRACQIKEHTRRVAAQWHRGSRASYRHSALAWRTERAHVHGELLEGYRRFIGEADSNLVQTSPEEPDNSRCA